MPLSFMMWSIPAALLVKLVAGGIGNMNLPAQLFQRASFVYSNRWAYSNRDNAPAVSRRVNGVCHRSSPRRSIHGIRSLVRRCDGAVRISHLRKAIE